MSDVLPLEGLVALVSGAARRKGIGHEAALELARAGADVVVTDVSERGALHLGEPDLGEGHEWGGLESVTAEIRALGRSASAIVGDVADERDVERIAAQSVAAMGKVDILFNNAAAPSGPDRRLLWETPDETYDRIFSVNTRGVFLMCRAFTPGMAERGWGRIINNASVAGRMGLAGQSVYSASKFAVVGLTQSMSRDAGPLGITVNAVCPGHIDTSRLDAGIAASGVTRDELERRKAEKAQRDNPVGRLGTPKDVAVVVRFLSLPASSYLTGLSINVAGGWIMN